MNKKMSFMTILLTLVFVVGCGSKVADPKDAQDKNNQIIVLEKKVKELEDENKVLKEENSALKSKIELLEGSGKPVVDNPAQEEGEEELPVFGADDQNQMILVSSVVVKTDEPLINKMQFLANELGDKVFGGLKIEVKSIDMIENKEILMVNLIEGTGDKDGKGWKDNYFQGSTGGKNTEIALVETFLQREYGGRWIQGVMFTLEGEKISQDHVPNLEGPIFR